MNERDIFLAAIDLPDPAARAAYLDRACAGDPALRHKVDALLRSHTDAGSFLGAPLVASADPDYAATRDFRADSADTDGDGARPADVLALLAPPGRPDSLGRIGHYEVLQILGQGAFGIVFRALDDVLQRVVAVKVLAPQLAATSPARKRFLREARSSAQIRHENVVQVYEVGEQPLPYLVMEFIPGETLQQRLDRTGPVDPTEVLRIGRQIAEGLAAAHANGLIHRDIKPGNVLIEGGPQKVRITDFGLARAADDASISQSGIIAGTPMYMSPEQATGAHIDSRADLFSLGSVLYQMVTGRPPFRASGTLAVLKRVAEDSPRPIREVIPETPRWLCDIIAKLHAKNPDDRYQSAREVADVLAACEERLKSNTNPHGFPVLTRAPAVGARRRKWAAAAAVLLLSPIALAVTEFAGVTDLFRSRQGRVDPIKPGEGPAPDPAAEPEPSSTFKNSLGMEFVRVPKGKSWLGGGNGRPGDKEVEVLHDFYLGKYEVTQNEWREVMGAGSGNFSRTGNGADDVAGVPDAELARFPVEEVTLEQCEAFVAKLNQRTTTKGWIYRLPTEEEWEYACRGGPMSDVRESAFDYYLSEPTNTLLPTRANFDRVLNRPSKVGSYAPNRLGLHDMHGNVWEWCKTAEALSGQPTISWRGGCWNDEASAERCRAASRWSGAIAPTDHHFALGLRLALVPSGARPPEAKAPAPDPAIDRKAAVYAMSLGHGVQINGTSDWRGNVEELPKTPFALTGVSLRDNKKLTDDGLLFFQGCRSLKHLDLTGTAVTDAGLANFKDCHDLKVLDLFSTNVGDAGLAHFKACRFTHLSLRSTNVTDATAAAFGHCTELTMLSVAHTKVTDAGLAHFRNCTKLKHLDLDELPVSDAAVAPFAECKNLEVLHLGGAQVTDAGAARFKGCKRLRILFLRGTKVTAAGIDDLKAALPQCRIEWDGGTVEPTAALPLPDDELKRVAALPADRQVAEVRKALQARNPGFDGGLTPTVEGAAVTGLALLTNDVADITPVRLLPDLRSLTCEGHDSNGKLTDLSPLRGTQLRSLNVAGNPITDLAPLRELPLTSFVCRTKQALDLAPLKGLPLTTLECGFSGVSDLSPLKGMKLTRLVIDHSPVSDLSPLAGMPLAHFHCGGSKGVADLSPLKGMPLTHLYCSDTGVSDLSPLKGMPLKELACDFRPERDAAVLRDIKTLETINYQPAEAFWAAVDRK